MKIKIILFLLVGLLVTSSASAEQTADPHAGHKAMMHEMDSFQRSVRVYDMDDTTVTTADSSLTTLAELVEDDKPVMVHFIFTTCTTICPVQAATFSQVQRQLGDEASAVQMISVSIDPEYDTPAKLRDYGEKFRAGPQWEFITGSTEAMIRVQKIFDAYEGNKMNHRPLTLIKIPGSREWIRLEGLIGASVIVEEYRKLQSRS